jgi:hypothetical protein
MNLQLIEIIQDGSAKTFVYQDLDNPEKLHRMTEKEMAEILIKSMQSNFKKLTDAFRSCKFESVSHGFGAFNAAYDKCVKSLEVKKPD